MGPSEPGGPGQAYGPVGDAPSVISPAGLTPPTAPPPDASPLPSPPVTNRVTEQRPYWVGRPNVEGGSFKKVKLQRDAPP